VKLTLITNLNTRRGYEVPGILFQAHLYTHSLLRGVTFDVLPFSSYALNPTMLPLLETFQYLLIWNSFSFSFGCLQYPEIFVTLKQTLFLETARSHSEPI